MKLFCPNCGSENDGMPGGRVTCRACTASFEVPLDTGGPGVIPPAAGGGGFGQAPASFGGQPVQQLPSSQPSTQPAQPSWSAPQPPAPSQQAWSPPQPLAPSQPAWSPPQGPAGGYGGQQTTNTLAIVSLVAGIICCIPFSGVIAIVTGSLAHGQINQSNGTQTGKGLATAGIVLGILAMAFSVLSIIASVLDGAFK